MKVAYITPNFPLNSETFACTDVRVLRELGAQVSVHALRLRRDDAASLLAERGLNDLPVTYNSAAATLRGLLRCSRSPYLLVETLVWLIRRTAKTPRHLLRSLLVLPRCFDILRSIERIRPDVVHLFWGHYPALVGRLVERMKRDRPVLSVFLGAYDMTQGYPPSVPVAKDADLIWTHGQCNLPDLAAVGIPPERVVLAYRGLDLRLFAEPDPPVQKVPRRVVAATRLERDKHVEDVLAAFQIARSHWPEASLVVLGDGPDRPYLEYLASQLGIADAVSFRGHVPQTVVRDELRRAEAFITMSREIGDRLTNAVKEAMASRSVPIASNRPGVTEMVTDGVDGFVVPEGDVQTAAGRLEVVFADPEATRRMAAIASTRMRERFDARRTMAIYLAQWASIVDRRRAFAGARR